MYDINQYRHLELKTFKPDIVFYQQPWQIPDKQNLINTSKYALIAYVPYCYHSQNSYVNYLLGFHGKLWKYFVETELHKKEYEQIYKAKNCIAVGSCKLDNYKLIDSSKINKIWKTTGKKRIIYAPHHFLNKKLHKEYLHLTKMEILFYGLQNPILNMNGFLDRIPFLKTVY